MCKQLEALDSDDSFDLEDSDGENMQNENNTAQDFEHDNEEMSCAVGDFSASDKGNDFEDHGATRK